MWQLLQQAEQEHNRVSRQRKSLRELPTVNYEDIASNETESESEEEKREYNSDFDRDNRDDDCTDNEEEQSIQALNQRQLQELKRKHSAPEHISIRETKRKTGKRKKLTETEISNEEAMAVASMKEKNNIPNATMVFGSAQVTNDKTVWQMIVAPTLVLFHIIKLDIFNCFRTYPTKDNPTLSHKELVRCNFHQRFPRRADKTYDGFWVRVQKGYETLRDLWDILMENAMNHFRCVGPMETETEDNSKGTNIVQPYKLNEFKVMQKNIRATLIMIHNEWRAHPEAETKDVQSEIIPRAMAKYGHFKYNL
jgi:hypothetical protein